MLLSKTSTIYREREYRVLEYTPSVFRPLIKGIEDISFVRRIRLLLQLINGGYKVYYFEVSGVLVGYNIIGRGGSRLKITTRKDLISGPSYVVPSYRGNGYLSMLKKIIIERCCSGYNNIYSWIAKDNVASIKSSLKCGFTIEDTEIIIRGKLRNLIEVPKGEGTNIIVKYKLKN